MANKMTDLLNKIERRLGTNKLHLPADLTKDTWADSVIVPDTLVVFSRYFPYMTRVLLSSANKKDGYYIIDEDLIDSASIIGVKDIAWDMFSTSGVYGQTAGTYGYYDYMNASYSVDDIFDVQMRADQMSIYNNGLYLDFKEPNMVKILTATNSLAHINMDNIPINIFIVHPSNLMTISPMKLNIFENLATADVASYLYEQLKYYDNLDTVFANVELKLESLETRAQQRDDIIQKLEDSYVSPANKYQPIMFTV